MRRASLLFLPVLASSVLLACGACQPRPGAETVAASTDDASEASPAPGEAALCEGAVGFDDGAYETGYGFVPSAKWGIYLQRFDSPELGGKTLEEVCVCWLKTRGDHTADFEIVVWDETDRRLAAGPFATVAGSAEDIPDSRETAGRLFPTETDGVTLPEAPFWVGVRWNPSVEDFLFVCADQDPEHKPVENAVPAVFQEDRAPGWADVLTAKDPIFKGHRALGLRIRVADGADD